MTAQEIFNIVWDHLITKASPKSVARRPARPDVDTCAYRGVNGAKCAVGVLIDDETALEWDTKSDSAFSQVDLPEHLAHLAPHTHLLCRLQEAHDRELSGDVQEDRLKLLRGVARDFALELPEGFIQ